MNQTSWIKNINNIDPFIAKSIKNYNNPTTGEKN